jgi:type I restriction enzyme R subunit
MTPENETDARILIDARLREAGWDPADKRQVRTEVLAVASAAGDESSVVREEPPGAAIAPERGRCDYVLDDTNGRPLAVLESKRGGIDPYTAKQQALPYAKRIGAPFIFLSDGQLIYFWDYQNDDARIVSSFYSQRDLERLVWLRKEAKPLATVPIPNYYIRDGENRQVRPYQQGCLKALDHSIELGKRRFLTELPTAPARPTLSASPSSG